MTNRGCVTNRGVCDEQGGCDGVVGVTNRGVTKSGWGE